MAQPKPILGQLDRDLHGSEHALLRAAYVFSGYDRILGFYGKLEVSADRSLTWSDFLACCTHVDTDVSLERAFVERSFEHARWARVTSNGGGLWRQGDYEIRIAGSDRVSENDLHVALSFGDGFKYLAEHLSGPLLRHKTYLLSQSSRQHQSNEQTEARLLSSTEAAARLVAAPFAVYTGAGVSAASGIPTFSGPGSLDEMLTLQEPFPGEVLAWMVGDPARLAFTIGKFQAQLLTSHPNGAHRLLAQLETRGLVKQLITTNIDLLHERSGSQLVVAPQVFLEQGPTKAFETLLVLGVSEDAHGIVEAARRQGSTIIAADIVPPAFLTGRDYYVPHSAETVLQALALNGIEPSAAPLSEVSFPLFGFSPHATDARRDLKTAIRNLPALLQAVSSRMTSGHSEIHGWRHWLETAWFGLQLLNVAADADPAVVFTFSLIHDSQRLNDSCDPKHGSRAAAFAAELNDGVLFFSDSQRDLLTAACEAHSEGYISDNATIAVCWDADRLGLWRVGRRPHPAGLSLNASRDAELIDAASCVQSLQLDWGDLFDQYALVPTATQ